MSEKRSVEAMWRHGDAQNTMKKILTRKESFLENQGIKELDIMLVLIWSHETVKNKTLHRNKQLFLGPHF